MAGQARSRLQRRRRRSGPRRRAARARFSGNGLGFWPALGTAIKSDLAKTTPSNALMNTATAAYGGSVIGDVLGLNRPRQPFQMGTAQAPSPIVSPGGGFTPTARTATEALMQQIAQRRAAQGKIRFA